MVGWGGERLTEGCMLSDIRQKNTAIHHGRRWDLIGHRRASTDGPPASLIVIKIRVLS